MAVLACLVLCPGRAETEAQEPPLLVLLADTGEERDGLPVLARHPGGGEVLAALSRGLPAMLLRVYRYEQVYLRQRRGTARRDSGHPVGLKAVGIQRRAR